MKSPFPLAPYKGKKAIVHIKQKEGEGRYVGERGQDGGELQISHSIHRWFLCFPRNALHGCRPPVTSHLSIQEAVFSLLSFVVWEKGADGREGGKSDIGLETCYCLPSRTTSQPVKEGEIE